MSAEKVLVLLIMLSTVAIETNGSVQEIGKESLPTGHLQNMQIYKGKLYIGGRNFIYEVDKDLDQKIFARTCNISGQVNCDNDNQVLIANQMTGMLVICGTGNNGSCQVWDMDKGLTLSSEELKVASDINRPAVGMILSDGNLMIAVAYGPNIPIKETTCRTNDKADKCLTYNYPISTRKLENQLLSVVSKENSGAQILNLVIRMRQFETTDKQISLDDYIIYYKSSFEYNGYSYFLTNQKEYVGGSNYVSKLIRICQNDTELRSYTDIFLTCHANGAVYNLLQSAILVDSIGIPSSQASTKKIISTFTKGSDPEKPVGDSVICMISLSEIDEAIVAAKRDNYRCKHNPDELQMYLPQKNPVIRCIWENETLPLSDVDCAGGSVQLYPYVIGNNTVNITSRFHLSAEHGYISTIHGFIQSTKNITLLAGTSLGKVFRLYIENNSIVAYDNFTADKGVAIKSIYQTSNSSRSLEASGIQDDEIIYIMSSSKILKYRGSNCSEYKTCNQTMEAHDPSCGWCVFENRSTRMKDCQEKKWLSSLKNCVSIEPVPQAVSVLPPFITKVEIRTKDLPAGRDQTDTYQCRFTYGSNTTMFPVNRTGDKFSCPLPNVTEHTDAILELWVKIGGTEFFLASHSFLFYNCSNYKRCSDCIQRNPHINCSWCYNAAKCVQPNTCGSDLPPNRTCPELKNNSATLYAHTEKETTLSVNVLSVTNALTGTLKIAINGRSGLCKAVGNVLACNITLSLQDPGWKKRYPIKILYKDNVELDDHFNNYVTVYNCEKFQMGCDYCNSLNNNYFCGWNRGDEKCTYKNPQNKDECPPPYITKLIPDNGPDSGGTEVSLEGLNFGTEDQKVITAVKLSEERCEKIFSDYYSKSDDFDKNVIYKIVCTANQLSLNSSYLTQPGPVVLTVGGIEITSSVVYNYKKPKITDVNPKKGPKAGGTRITLVGENLGVGNQNVKILLNNNNCKEATVLPVIQSSSWNDRSKIPFYMECLTPEKKQEINQSTIRLLIDEKSAVQQHIIDYAYLPNPIIHHDQLNLTKGIVSGGIAITILGSFLDNANVATIKGKDKDGVELISKCDIINSTMAVCKGPKATKGMEKELNSYLEQTGSRRKRSTCETGCISVEVYVYFDGVNASFMIEFYQDPTINESNEVVLFGTRERELTIRGKNLNLVAKESDINITIGLGTCTVFKLTSDYLTCIAPTDEPQKADANSPYPEIKVRIGNIQRSVGYIEYKKEVELLAIIAGSVGGVMFAVIVIGGSVGILKYKKIRKKSKQYQRNLSDMEMEIRKVAREEFLDMHTTMSSVNRNLVEQGFPYHSYQQYACNVMFSVDYLWTEPVVSNGKMTDDERIKANKGMELMESLIYNKFFIVSVISTMEKQKRFFIREKANLAGNLCAVLMGKMDYLEEILKMLLSNLVQETQSKKQKSLFRRCESITEKLLSNWLSLCLYPHIRANSGSPLYLLYIATQKTMESGPIDAILGGAKYTLFEEKLLKKWSSAEEGTQDLKFEAKTLTLNVVVDNGDTIFKCKVLDCDTISQVKSKCMAQIYVNYPASQLNVDPQDLDLEWHEGFGGALRLKDEDNTSKHDGPWVRLNTLAHYNVKDESNMALVDPHGAENREEDYVNLTNVNVDNACNASVDSTEPLHPRDMQNPGALQHWHLVRKEEETSKQGKSAIAELYLNRLFTTKQCLMEYISTLFNIVLEKDRCPPPTKCLFDFLDDLGDRHKIDADTLYTWKSHSYAIRVWASLIKMPSLLFDVNIPNYVEENLDVISQVFIESFSLSSQKFTKDSPSQKLIFHNEMNQYRDKVKEFYKNVKVDSQAQDEYRQYMTEVNKQQQQTNFNKVSALYRLYKQLKPYFEEILEDLTTCKETSNLRLNKKLEEVMEIMEDEEK